MNRLEPAAQHPRSPLSAAGGWSCHTPQPTPPVDDDDDEDDEDDDDRSPGGGNIDPDDDEGTFDDDEDDDEDTLWTLRAPGAPGSGRATTARAACC